MVMLINAQAVGNSHRLVLRIDGSARVSLLLGIVPVRAIAIEIQIQLSLLHLRFLQAEEISIQCLESISKSFVGTGPQPVHVPRNQFHDGYLYY